MRSMQDIRRMWVKRKENEEDQKDRECLNWKIKKEKSKDGSRMGKDCCLKYIGGEKKHDLTWILRNNGKQAAAGRGAETDSITSSL